MDHSVSSNDYKVLLKHLRKARKASGLTQMQLAERLGQTQTFVSKCERGERRLDAIEIRFFCIALNISFVKFIQELEPNLTDALDIKIAHVMKSIDSVNLTEIFDLETNKSPLLDVLDNTEGELGLE